MNTAFTNYQVQHELYECDQNCDDKNVTIKETCQSIDDSLKDGMNTMLWQMCCLGTCSSHDFTNPEFSICNWVFFEEKLTVMLAFCNLFGFLNENLFQKDQDKQQISWEKKNQISWIQDS